MKKNSILKLFLLFTLYFVFGFNHIDVMKKSFGMIQVGVKALPTKNSKADLLALHILNTIIDKPFLRASSFIVKKSINSTSLVTSAHVCNEIDTFKKNDNFSKVKSNVLLVTNISSFFNLNEIENHIKIVPNIYVRDFYGKKHTLISIDKINNSSDLCRITTKDSWGLAVRLSLKECIYGERLYNIAASAGFYSPNSVPFREGNYSGVHEEYEDNSSNFKNLYTIEALPGSSGSGVFNKKGEVCGNINISYSKSNLSLGATRKDISNILE
tara:strand:+ start:2045 stop:2854 length:810 start_codon:yes stop_codon:yes gene_type:complete